jgi:hypothetical protein
MPSASPSCSFLRTYASHRRKDSSRECALEWNASTCEVVRNEQAMIIGRRDLYALAGISVICFVAIPIGRSIGIPAQVSSVVSRSPWFPFTSGRNRPVLIEPPPFPAMMKGRFSRVCRSPSSRPDPHIMIQLSSNVPSPSRKLCIFFTM